MIGICSGLLFMRHYEQITNYIYYWGFVTFLAIGFSVYVFISNQYIIKYQHNGMFAPVFLLFIYWFSLSKNGIVKLFSTRVFQYLGELSYAVYILQIPIFYIFYYLLYPYYHFTTNSGFIVYFSILLLSSIITFELIEKPSKNYFSEKLKVYLQN